jgi:hypothetical protein
MDDCVEAAGPSLGRALPNRRTSSAAHPTGDENKAFFGTAPAGGPRLVDENWRLLRTGLLLGLVASLVTGGCSGGDGSIAYDLIASRAVASEQVERPVLDVGATGSRPYLERGFSWTERADDGTTFAWSSGDASVALFELHATEPRRAVLRGFPYEPDDTAEGRAAVEVSLNGHTLGTLVLRPGVGTHTLEAPSETLRYGANRLALRYTRTFRQPAGARHRRSIAVAWDAFALLPSEPTDDAASQLDAALASTSRPQAGATSPARYRGAMLLPAGTARTWTIDLGPGTELHLGRLRSAAGPPVELVIWLEDATAAAPRVLRRIADPRGSERVPIPVDRFATVRLTLAATRPKDSGLDPRNAGGAIIGRAWVVAPLNSPFAAPAGSGRGVPRALAARPP